MLTCFFTMPFSFLGFFHSHKAIYRLEDILGGNSVKRIAKSIRKQLDVVFSNLNF